MSSESIDNIDWSDLQRPTPEWFKNSPFGIFVHWGAYSVPAWAEPIGALGTVEDDREWFTHNPYAEWYMNTIAIEGSPAQKRHADVYGDLTYDDFLDEWKAENFDPEGWAELFRFAGADYVVPTTKHHDGITLWDAPGTGERNVVKRGPRRDLVGEIAEAVKRQGMHLGLYYSGGLDWHIRPFHPHISAKSLHDTDRPKDVEYANYAFDQVADLVDKFQPEILWNDIEWPDGGKHFGEKGLGTLFKEFYEKVPTGVVNDRWGQTTHRDYTTSEYESGRERESAENWENCRGVGFSFGYNQVEGPEQSLSGVGIARQLVDVVSRGGHFLLNVGPKADGTIPDIQRIALLDLGEWMKINKERLVGSSPFKLAPENTSSTSWIRWVQRETGVVVFVDALNAEASEVELEIPEGYRVASEEAVSEVEAGGRRISVGLPAGRKGPVSIDLVRELEQK